MNVDKTCISTVITTAIGRDRIKASPNWDEIQPLLPAFVPPQYELKWDEFLSQPSIMLSARLEDKSQDGGAATLGQSRELARARKRECDYRASPDLDYSRYDNIARRVVKQDGPDAGRHWRDFAVIVTHHSVPNDIGVSPASYLASKYRLSLNLRSNIETIEWKKNEFCLYHLAATGLWRNRAKRKRLVDSAFSAWYVVAADFTTEDQVKACVNRCPGLVLSRLSSLPSNKKENANPFEYVKALV